MEKKLFTAKVEENLLESFKHACTNQDTTASQAVRAFMRDYVRKHGQGDLFNPPKPKPKPKTTPKTAPNK